MIFSIWEEVFLALRQTHCTNPYFFYKKFKKGKGSKFACIFFIFVTLIRHTGRIDFVDSFDNENEPICLVVIWSHKNMVLVFFIWSQLYVFMVQTILLKYRYYTLFNFSCFNRYLWTRYVSTLEYSRIHKIKNKVPLFLNLSCLYKSIVFRVLDRPSTELKQLNCNGVLTFKM